MPTVNRPHSTPSQRRKQRQKYYNTKQWRELRQYLMMLHPFCTRCADRGVTSPTQQLHHINSPFDYGLTEVERMARLLDINNIMPLCTDCHSEMHGGTKRKDKILQLLDEFSN